jgi:thiamine transport system substrate-binding protein
VVVQMKHSLIASTQSLPSLLILLCAAICSLADQSRGEALPQASAPLPKLVIYTYDSFASKWGPGPALEAKFSASCHCKIEWAVSEDGAALINRLRLEGKRATADLVIGLDASMMQVARDLDAFAPTNVGQTKEIKLPIAFDGLDLFVPFDFGVLAVMHDTQKMNNPPKSWAEFLRDEKWKNTLVIEDPRTSSVGQGLLFWYKLMFGSESNAKWGLLHSRVLTMAKGWTQAYGMFLKGEVPLVLSYTTSELYHRIMDKSDRYRALHFNEGHYVQVEVAGILKTAKNAALATDFLRLMLSPESQAKIATSNWMYPVLPMAKVPGLPKEFLNTPTPTKYLIMDPKEARAHRDQWVAEWQTAFR